MLISKQRGSMLIGVIFLIIIIGAIVAMIANIAIVNSQSTANRLDTTQAFYDAEAGRENSAYLLMTTNVAQRKTCSSVASSLGTVTFGNNGTYQVTGTTNYPTGSVASLTSNIANSGTVSYIPLSGNLSSYAPVGRVMIDNEFFDYGAKSSSSGACGGTPPCLTNIQRARIGTSMAAHYIGTPVGQDQCAVTVQGSYPNASSPTGQRQITYNLLNVGNSTAKGWATSSTLTSNFLGSYDGANWTWSNGGSGISSAALNSIDALSYAYTWAVGKDSTNTYLALLWNGNSWNRVTGPSIASSTLNGVSCVDSNHCWMVGNPKILLQWNGSTLGTASSDSTISSLSSNALFNSISCINSNGTNYCWAVGDDGHGSPLFLYWNGSTWSKASSGQIASNPNNFLSSVSCVPNGSSYFCTAVGGASNMSQPPSMANFNGTQWSNYTYASKAVANGVFCIDATDCFAVGQYPGPYGLFNIFNGTTWSAPSGNTPNNTTLNSVDCSFKSTTSSGYGCWVAGQGGTIWYYDGSTWTTFSSGTSNNLSDIEVISYSTQSQNVIIWQETN